MTTQFHAFFCYDVEDKYLDAFTTAEIAAASFRLSYHKRASDIEVKPAKDGTLDLSVYLFGGDEDGLWVGTIRRQWIKDAPDHL